MSSKRRIAVFGATGSVGRQALEIIHAHPDTLSVCCVSANTDAAGLAAAAEKSRAELAALTSDSYKGGFSANTKLLSGAGALSEALIESSPDMAVIAVSGMNGLPLLAECLRRGIPVALANKEAIVAGGDVVTQMRRQSESTIIPLDSEHAALFQCLGDSFDTRGVRQFWITASGGPFLRWTSEEIERATPGQALRHPTWSMGRKITIDSASLANKGLEVIEARYLFDMSPDRLRVVVQPDSLVHSMVEFEDTSVLAQFAPPDMHLPIRRALLGPGAQDDAGAAPLDFWTLGRVSFEAPDTNRFPCLSLAYDALEAGGAAPAVYNAADEAAALAFADGAVPFGAIPRLIREALDKFGAPRAESVEGIQDLDARVRHYVRARLEKEY